MMSAEPIKPPLYLFGVPGKVGGAATKITHLIRLLHRDFQITVVPPSHQSAKDREVRSLMEPFQVRAVPLKELPKQLDGVGLAICERDFFATGRARELKERGLRLVWSNEMMFAFKGEAEAAQAGGIDRVLFVSEFQAQAFADTHRGVPSFLTGNYIDPDDFPWHERRHPVFTLGRLSRADLEKYPLNFPSFYEELGLKEVRYRVMAWNPVMACSSDTALTQGSAPTVSAKTSSRRRPSGSSKPSTVSPKRFSGASSAMPWVLRRAVQYASVFAGARKAISTAWPRPIRPGAESFHAKKVRIVPGWPLASPK